MGSFLFYDIETSGLNPAFDQVLTFAAIRTDLSLNELGRESITVRLRKDIVPSPKAFFTHGLTPGELESGITEYEAAKKIHKLVNTPGTISLGYNSFGFDDEFLRFLFYRNLLDPYSHQYSQGCSRMDILPVTVIYRLFCPMHIVWPQIDGKPSLKLELISRENAFETSGKAHEAMSDVEALVALSRIFYREQPVWNYALNFFNKKKEEVRMHGIEKDFLVQGRPFRVALMLSTAFGPDKNYMAPVLHLGSSHPYKNQSLWLRLDQEDILGLKEGLEIPDTAAVRKRAADALIVLPPLERFWHRLPEISRSLAQDNMKTIQGHWERFFEIGQYHCGFKYPYVPEMDMDAALYQDGFFTVREKQDSQLFHRAEDAEKYQIVEEISSPRIKKIASRILFRNFNGPLPESIKADCRSYMARLKSAVPEDQIIGYKNDVKLNVHTARQDFEQIKALISSPDSAQKKVIENLDDLFIQFMNSAG